MFWSWHETLKFSLVTTLLWYIVDSRLRAFRLVVVLHPIWILSWGLSWDVSRVRYQTTSAISGNYVCFTVLCLFDGLLSVSCIYRVKRWCTYFKSDTLAWAVLLCLSVVPLSVMPISYSGEVLCLRHCFRKYLLLRGVLFIHTSHR